MMRGLPLLALASALCGSLQDSDSKRPYGIRGLPVAYLLDPRGVVVWEGIRVLDTKEARPELETAIKDEFGKLNRGILQEDVGKGIDALLPKLGSDLIEERDAAQAELRQLVESNPKGARPALKSRIASVTQAEVRQALKAALARLPALELKIELAGEATLGRSPALKVRIQNVSDEEQMAVRSLDGSDAGARYPRIDVQILGPDGKRGDQPLPSRGNDLKSLSPVDFVKLAPGGEVDPFGTGGFEHGVLKNWRPTRTGRHTVRIIVDYAERNIGHWMGTAAMQDSYLDKLEGMLSKVPRLRVEASLVIDVKQ